MTYKEIQELIKLINKSELTEFKMKQDDFELVIRTKEYRKTDVKTVAASPSPSIVSIPAPAVTGTVPPQAAAPAPAAPTATPDLPLPSQTEQQEAKDDSSQYLEIKSPIVGTFYRSPGPDKPPFKKVGDMVTAGETVCIVEAMKLFNEIESEISGKIVKVTIEDASPVEYDQVLFLVDPKG